MAMATQEQLSKLTPEQQKQYMTDFARSRNPFDPNRPPEPSLPTDSGSENLDKLLAYLDTSQKNALALNEKYASEGIKAMTDVQQQALDYFKPYAELGAASAKDFSSIQPFSFDASSLENDPVLKWMLDTSAKTTSASLAAQGVLGASGGIVAQEGQQQGIKAGYAQQAYLNALNTWSANKDKALQGIGVGQNTAAAQSGIVSNTAANIANIKTGQATGQMGVVSDMGRAGGGFMNSQQINDSNILAQYQLNKDKNASDLQGAQYGALTSLLGQGLKYAAAPATGGLTLLLPNGTTTVPTGTPANDDTRTYV